MQRDAARRSQRDKRASPPRSAPGCIAECLRAGALDDARDGVCFPSPVPACRCCETILRNATATGPVLLAAADVKKTRRLGGQDVFLSCWPSPASPTPAVFKRRLLPTPGRGMTPDPPLEHLSLSAGSESARAATFFFAGTLMSTRNKPGSAWLAIVVLDER